MNGVQPSVKNYTLQWAALFFIIAGAAWVLFFRPHSLVSVPQADFLQQRRAAVQADKDWFLILKIPETTQGMSTTLLQERFDMWLSVLMMNGYHPVLLSDALQKLKRGQALPPKAVVLSFDPGYRQTFETLSPILARRGVPALWITQKKLLDRADLRYLSWHQLGRMKKSGLWDIGLKNASEKFQLTGNLSFFERLKLISGGRLHFDDAPLALNRRPKDGTLRRLNVNFKWSSQEFINRLKAELPVESPVYLTAKSIQERPWGIAEAAPKGLPVFDLAANPSKRSNSISWQGSAGLRNFHLTMNIGQLFGEAWLILRSDPSSEKSVNIGFTRDALVVEEYLSRKDKRLLAASPWRNGPATSPRADITLRDDMISVSAEGGDPILNSIKTPGSAHSAIELRVYDKVRGAAEAKSIEMFLRPLPGKADAAEETAL